MLIKSPSQIHTILQASEDYLSEDLHQLLEQIDVVTISDLPDEDRAKLAAACWRCGQIEKAIILLDWDWTKAPHDAAGLAGAILLSLGLIDTALPILKWVVQGQTRDPGAHLVNLGRALVLTGKPKEALTYLEQSLVLASHDHSLVHRSLAEAYLALSQPDEALAYLPEDTNDVDLIAGRAVVLGTIGRHEEAANFLRKAMTRMPDDMGLLLLRADLAEIRGRTGEVIGMLRKALDKDPENLDLWVRLSKVGNANTLHAGARAAADKALSLAKSREPPARALALTADAHVKADSGDVDGAEVTYREALQLVPGFLPALSPLGNLLMQKGRVEDAVACFQQVRATAPLQGWAKLIHVTHSVPDDPKIIENIENAARIPSLEGPVRAGLLFTAAGAWDRKKDYDRAMRVAHEANLASKKHLPYRPETHRAEVDKEIARFSSAFMKSRADWGHPSRVPIFVLGMPRSGTTLTEQILGGHSKVHGAGELSQISQFMRRLVTWERKLGSGLRYPECAVELSTRDLQAHGQQMLNELLALAPSKVDHVIDKLPHNFQHIGLIKLLYPNATIFHCRRDARDIAISNYVTDYAAKFGGMGFAYDLSWIGEQLVDHDRLMAHWHRIFPGQIMEVIYEDLVEDTEDWARRMIEHIGLEWEPEVLNFQDLDRPVKTASVWQVRQPVYTTSKARWKRYEAHLGPLETALSYIPKDPEPSPLPPPPGLFDAAMDALKAGRTEDAKIGFQTIIAQNPRHAAAYHFLGAALMQAGQLQQARKMIRRSIKLRPGHSSWLSNLAKIETALGNYEAAAKANEKASTKLKTKRIARSDDLKK